MSNEILIQIIITIGALIGSLMALVPTFVKRARERRSKEELQALARTALDGWGDAMNILRPIMITESDSGRTKRAFERLEKEYDAAWAVYRGGALQEEK